MSKKYLAALTFFNDTGKKRSGEIRFYEEGDGRLSEDEGTIFYEWKKPEEPGAEIAVFRGGEADPQQWFSHICGTPSDGTDGNPPLDERQLLVLQAVYATWHARMGHIEGYAAQGIPVPVPLPDELKCREPMLSEFRTFVPPALAA